MSLPRCSTTTDEDRILAELHSFLETLDTSKPSWKSDTLSLVRELLSNSRISGPEPEKSLTPPRPRIARFSVGDEEEEQVEEDGVCGDRSSPVKKSSLMQTVAEPMPTPLEVRPTLDRTVEELEADWKNGVPVRPGDALRLLNTGRAKARELERRMGDLETAVAIRRSFVAPGTHLAALPFAGYDYKYVSNSCCENVVGYIPVPVGVAGPIKINGDRTLFVPMATTEGALIASTNRGCTAIMKSGGVSSHVYEEGMTRAPAVQFLRASDAIKLKKFINDKRHYEQLRSQFESTSNFVRLKRVDPHIDGNIVHLRFVADCGDAMGMNMLSKATSHAMRWLQAHEFFRDTNMRVVALSGNLCTDKKAAAINWVEGRGRSVVADCVLPEKVVRDVLKTTPAAIAEVSRAKFGSGSSMAGAIGGANAHAANVVAAVFIATGQDAAQVTTSSMCSTRMELAPDGSSLYCSVTLPCMEVGTVGGGTILPPQRECLQLHHPLSALSSAEIVPSSRLGPGVTNGQSACPGGYKEKELLGIAGPSAPPAEPGTNARRLAEVVAATVLAGELSLLAALATDDLVSSHLKLNRSRLDLYSLPPSPRPAFPATASTAPKLCIRGKEKERKVDCQNIL